jgi:signal peptidase complex subunit 3
MRILSLIWIRVCWTLEVAVVHGEEPQIVGTLLMCAIDLSTLFNWNTKQVFLYLKAVYPSTNPNEPASEAIIWDAILPGTSAPWHQTYYTHPTPPKTTTSKSKKSKAAKAAKAKQTSEPLPYAPGILKLPSQRPKYQITDISGKLQNRTDVRLELGWNVQPWVGLLLWDNWEDWGMWEGMRGGKSATFDFPSIKEGKVGAKLDVEKGKEGHRLVVGEEQPLRRKGT